MPELTTRKKNISNILELFLDEEYLSSTDINDCPVVKALIRLIKNTDNIDNEDKILTFLAVLMYISYTELDILLNCKLVFDGNIMCFCKDKKWEQHFIQPFVHNTVVD